MATRVRLLCEKVYVLDRAQGLHHIPVFVRLDQASRPAVVSNDPYGFLIVCTVSRLSFGFVPCSVHQW